MCDQCDDGAVKLVLQGLRADIARYGWAAQYLAGDPGNAGFGYTVGFSELKHPEVLVSGRCPNETYSLLEDLAVMVVSHKHTLQAGMILNLYDRRVCLVPIEHPGNVLLTAEAFYGTQMRAFQAVWTDDDGRFPWQQSPPDVLTQPLYGDPSNVL